ncbi:Ankyrin repeat domain-containing protein 7 [Chamberlinius hualienensis]
MKRFFKLGQKLTNGNDRKRNSNEGNHPLSRLSSLSGSSSGWGSVTSFHTDDRSVYCIEKFDIKGFNKLHKACWLGNLDKVKKHTKTDNINKQDAENRTPLHLASAQGHKSIVIHLLNCKADFEIKDSNGRTPLLVSICNRQRDIWRILLEKGANINEKSFDGNTGLHLATREGDEDAIVALISKGANINAANIEGVTPIHVATSYHQVEILKLLLRFGANINMPDKHQMTALMIACQKGFEDIVELFVIHDVAVTAVNSDGLTAEDIARLAENDDCIMILQKYKKPISPLKNEDKSNVENDIENALVKQTETKSDSDSWNDDFSEELPLDESMKSQIIVPKSLNLKLNFESMGLDAASQNSSKMFDTHDDNIIAEASNATAALLNDDLSLQKISDGQMSPVISLEVDTKEKTKEKMLSNEEDKTKSNEIQLRRHTNDDNFERPILTSTTVDKDLLSELGLSEISDFSNSLPNENFQVTQDGDTDIEDIDEVKATDGILTSLNVGIYQDRNKSDEGSLESQNDIGDESSFIATEKNEEFNETKVSKEGTLGRFGTMQEIEEIWETNACAVVDTKTENEEDVDESQLYYAELAIVNSRDSTIERVKTTNSPAAKDIEILIEKLPVEINQNEHKWEEVCQHLFGLIEENDEISPSLSVILTEEELRDNSSAKDVTFQEISLTDEASVVSTKEDLPYTILSSLIKDSSNNEKVLSVIQRLRRVWVREQNRCHTLQLSNKLLNDEIAKYRAKYDSTYKDYIETKNKICDMEALLETQNLRLVKEEAKSEELELNLQKCRTQLDNIEETYLSEVNLRQKVQVALTASQEELRATEEIIDELRDKKVLEQYSATVDNTEAVKPSKELKDKDDEIQRLTIELNYKNDEIEKLKKVLTNKDEEIVKLKEESMKTIDEMRQMNEEIVKCNCKINKMKEESVSKDEEFKKLNEALLKNNEDINKINEENQTKSEEMGRMQNSWTEMKQMCNVLEIEKNDLLRQLEDYKLNERDQLVENAQRDLHSSLNLRETLEKKQAEINDLQENMVFAQKEKGRLTSVLNAARSECEKLKLELSGAENIITLTENKNQENLIRDSKEIQLLQNKLQLLELEYKSCKSELEDTKKLNTFYENSSNGVQTKWQTMMESFQKQHGALSREIIDMKEKALEEKCQLMSEVNNLTITNRDVKMQLNVLSEENKRLNERLSTAERNLLEKEKVKFEIETNIKLLQQENQRTTQQIEQFCEREKEYLAKLQNYSVTANEIESLKSRLAFETSKYDAEVENNNKWCKEITHLREEIDRLKTINKNLEIKVENLNREIASKEHETALLQNQTVELSKTKAELLLAMQQIRELNENIRVKEEDIEQLKATHLHCLKLTQSPSDADHVNNIESAPFSDTHSSNKRDIPGVELNGVSLDNISHMLESFIKEVKEDRKSTNAESRANFGQQDESNIWKSDMELLRAQLETRYRLELNTKLQQINQFLEEQGRTTTMLDGMEFHKRNEMHREYKTALRNMEIKLSKMQLYMKDKEIRQKELERQYHSLAELMKIKKRIKRKLNQHQSLQLTEIDNQKLLMEDYRMRSSQYKGANFSLLTNLGL